MASVYEYVTSNGFNKNIFLEGREEYDMSKFGKAFFPGNEVLNPPVQEEEEKETEEPTEETDDEKEEKEEPKE